MAATGIYEWRKTGKQPGFGDLVGEQPANPMSPATTAGQPTSGSPFGVTQANRTALGGGSMFGDLVKEGNKPATPSFSDLLGSVEPQRQQAMQGAYGAVNQGFQAPTGPSAESQIALNDFDKQAAAARRAVEEKSALSGRVATGQNAGDLSDFLSQQLLPQRADLGARLSAQDANQATTRQQNSFQNLLNLEGLGSQENLAGKQIQAGRETQERDIAAQERMQGRDIASREKLGAADLSLRERALVQEGTQFKDELAFKRYATEKQYTDAEAQRAWQAIQNQAGIQSQEKIAFANLSQEERQLAQQAMQFNSELDFRKSEAAAGRSEAAITRAWEAAQQEKQLQSQEKVAFAGLSQRERELAQAGQLAKDELAFKKFATEGGWSQQEADRTWQAMQQDKDIASREKVAFAGLSQQDRALAQEAMLAGNKLAWEEKALKMGLDDKTAERIWSAAEAEKARGFEAGESALGRELQKYVADSGFSMDAKKLEEQVRQFNSKLDFDTWATKAGLDDKTAERIWKSNEADVQRKWESGETLTAQQHEINLSRVQEEIDRGKIELNNMLNLTTIESQQAHDKVMARTQNMYQQLRDESLFSHEEAMAAAQQSYAKELEQIGYTHEQAMQAADIAARAAEGERVRNHETLLARAEMAQKDRFFAQEMGLNREQLQLDKDRFKQEVSQYLDVKDNADFDRLMDLSATLSAVAGDDPDAQRFAAETFFKGVGNLKDSQGNPLLSPEDVQRGLAAIKAEASGAGGTSAAPAAPVNLDTVEQGVSVLMQNAPKLGAGADTSAIEKGISDLAKFWEMDNPKDASDFGTIAMVEHHLTPLLRYRGTLDDAAIRKMVPFVPSDIMDRVFANDPNKRTP